MQNDEAQSQPELPGQGVPLYAGGLLWEISSFPFPGLRNDRKTGKEQPVTSSVLGV